MPPDVDQRYRPRGGGIRRQLKVGLERAFLAALRRPSDVWVRTFDPACKVKGSRRSRRVRKLRRPSYSWMSPPRRSRRPR